jgi:hypothetical protein
MRARKRCRRLGPPPLRTVETPEGRNQITKGMRGAQLKASRPKGESCTTKLILRADDAQIKMRLRQCCAAACTKPP